MHETLYIISPIIFFANEQYFLLGPSWLSLVDAVQINCQHNVQCESLRPKKPPCLLSEVSHYSCLHPSRGIFLNSHPAPDCKTYLVNLVISYFWKRDVGNHSIQQNAMDLICEVAGMRKAASLLCLLVSSSLLEITANVAGVTDIIH